MADHKLLERQVASKHEDLSDLLTNADRKHTPFCSRVKQGPAPNDTLFRWPVDDYPSPNLDGAKEEADTTEYENFDGRKEMANVIQIFERKPGVGRLTQKVVNPAGIGKKQAMAKNIAKGMVMIKRDKEATFLSNKDASRQTDANTQFETQGACRFVRVDNTGVTDNNFHLPTGYTPSAEQVVTVNQADFDDDVIRDIMEAIWDNTGAAGDFVGFCGSGIKKLVSNLTSFVAGANHTVNLDMGQNKITKVVDILDTDFGVVELLLSSFLNMTDKLDGDDNPVLDTQGRNVKVKDKWKLLFLDMDMVEVRTSQKATWNPHEDKGGGPRGLIEEIAGLCFKNCLGMGQLTVTPT